MLELLLVPFLLVGVTKDARGMRIGNKFVGGAGGAGASEEAKKVLADLAQAREDFLKGKTKDRSEMEKLARQLQDESPLGKGKGKGEKESKDGGSLEKLIDKNQGNLIGMTGKEIDKLKKLTKDSSPDELADTLQKLGGVDYKTFDPYIDAHRQVYPGKAMPIWNESLRQLNKIMDTDDPDQIDSHVRTVISRGNMFAGVLRNPDPKVVSAAAKDKLAEKALVSNPTGYFKSQADFYAKEMPKIATRMGEIRKAQIKRDEERKAQQAKSASKSKPATNDDVDIDGLF